MKLPNWLRIIWWAVLLGVVTYFMIQRYNSFVNGSATPMDVVIFLIWISLLLVPLFQEVSLFGVKLKKEFDSLKSDIKEQIINLRSEIQNSVDIQTQINPQIHLSPPPDSQLPAIEERFRLILEETLRNQGIQRPVVTPSEVEDIPDNIRFLFSIRHGIEKQLRRIWKQRFGEGEAKRSLAIHHIINSLIQSELMDSRLASVIRQVYAICSPAIHGEQVSDSQVRFVQEIAPELITSLKAIH